MKKSMQNKENTGVKKNQSAEIWRQFRRNKGAMVGLTVVIMLVLIAIFADVIWDYDVDIAGINTAERLQGPSWEHPFGTDQMGRDMLARVGYGVRYAIVIGFTAALGSVAIGLPIGMIAGYAGGKIDILVMRLVDAFDVIPGILLSILLVSVFGTNLTNLIFAMAVSSVPGITRTSRAAVLSVRYNEYIESAKAIGASDLYIIVRHILPNCFSPILVWLTLRMGGAIISASALSYIGLGVPVPMPEWGALLSASKEYLLKKPYLCMFPGLVIMITVMAINLVGDGLRDAFDPKLKR